jgi:hypothetical protein
MTAIQQRSQRFDLRAFMVKHQYKVMLVSLAVGVMWVGIHHLVAASWLFSRLSLLLAVVSFVPAGLVVLVHGRELGPFFWWDRSNVVLTTRRPRRLEKVEFAVMVVLWAAIFVFVVVVIFSFSL